MKHWMYSPCSRQFKLVGHFPNSPGHKKWSYESLLQLPYIRIFELKMLGAEQDLITRIEHLFPSSLIDLEFLSLLSSVEILRGFGKSPL